MAADNELPVWTIRPNWSAGIIERLEWLTDVMGSTYGTEQRRALRLSPRRSFDILFNPLDAARSYFDLWLHRFGSDEFMLPLFHDAGRLSASVLAGDDTIPLDTTFREFVADGMAVIVGNDPFVFDVLEITAVTDDALTIDPLGLANAWPQGSSVFPLRRSRVEQDSLFAALTTRAGEATIQFQLNQANDLPDEGDWDTLYNGVPILLDPPNRRENLDLNYMRQTLMIDNDVGIRQLLDDAGRAFTIQKHMMMMAGRAEHWAFRQMLYRLRGMDAPVWIPTFNNDLTLSRAALAAATQIDVNKIGYAYTGGAVDGRRHILLNKTIGREINGTAGALSAAEERLTLTAAIGTNLAAGVTGSFMDIARLDTDLIEITHHTDTDGSAECTLPFHTFRDERVIVDPIYFPIPQVAERSAECGQTFSQIVNVSAVSNAVFPGDEAHALVKGITLSGFDPSNVLQLSMPPGQFFTAWSPWGRPAYSSSRPSTSGSSNRLAIITDGNPASITQIGTAGTHGTFNQFDGYEEARAAWGVHTVTGHASYTFFISDTPISDNSGGLSVLVELI